MNINRLVMTDILLKAAHENADSGEHKIAIGLFEQVLRNLEASFGKESLKLTGVLADLSDCYEAVGLDLQARQCRSRLSTILLVA